ncbi:hypothetical protein HJG60_011052 [Phyllostomus discolor]|uniref:Uncharacterized protein n=1 Tax=Phyllostomus discolor TaxID=89673 RepID=A0A834AHL0_9CHIR|nr:hypothetical protein HJG60_011052 [Phyllostomus discolor]
MKPYAEFYPLKKKNRKVKVRLLWFQRPVSPLQPGRGGGTHTPAHPRAQTHFWGSHGARCPWSELSRKPEPGSNPQSTRAPPLTVSRTSVPSLSPTFPERRWSGPRAWTSRLRTGTRGAGRCRRGRCRRGPPHTSPSACTCSKFSIKEKHP